MSSSLHKSSRSSNNTIDTSTSQKKPSLFVRFIKSTIFQISVFLSTVTLLGVGYAAWTTLTPAQGASGQVMTQTLMQGIINNLNDLNTRVSSEENRFTEKLDLPSWLPKHMLCTASTNKYIVELYSNHSAGIIYLSQNDDVGLRADPTTYVITNIGYCGNLNGMTVSGAIAADLAW